MLFSCVINFLHIILKDALGKSLEDIFKTVQGGCLVFFPSYKLMDKLCKRWCETGQWSQLNAKKPLFVGKVFCDPLTWYIYMFGTHESSLYQLSIGFLLWLIISLFALILGQSWFFKWFKLEVDFGTFLHFHFHRMLETSLTIIG